MAPVIHELRRRKGFTVSVVSSAQHRDLLGPLLDFFGIAPDRDLDAMTGDQGLAALTSRLIERISSVLAADRPNLVVAQGDTTTVMASAVACFYARIPFAHVEAGLRTGNLQHPFPEEFNRVVADRIAAFNFAPTETARANLLREGIAPETISVTGNTVIDALEWTVARGPEFGVAIEPGQRLLLVTLHRRESFGAPLARAFAAIRQLAAANPDLVVLYPVHPNPNVAEPASRLLDGHARIRLVAPLDYPQMVAAMRRAHLILTDSGGIQEEAAALGVPVLVAREATERVEAIELGLARLVGTETERVVAEAQNLLDCPDAHRTMARGGFPFGDGQASRRIADIIEAGMGADGAS
jgi:UDP-N-acetylglucosamine 2-epimerase (non-hydrolysing)